MYQEKGRYGLQKAMTPMKKSLRMTVEQGLDWNRGVQGGATLFPEKQVFAKIIRYDLASIAGKNKR